MRIHNIDTIGCLTNGQLGELKDVIKTKKGEFDKNFFYHLARNAPD